MRTKNVRCAPHVPSSTMLLVHRAYNDFVRCASENRWRFCAWTAGIPGRVEDSRDPSHRNRTDVTRRRTMCCPLLVYRVKGTPIPSVIGSSRLAAIGRVRTPVWTDRVQPRAPSLSECLSRTRAQPSIHRAPQDRRNVLVRRYAFRSEGSLVNTPEYYSVCARSVHNVIRCMTGATVTRVCLTVKYRPTTHHHPNFKRPLRVFGGACERLCCRRTTREPTKGSKKKKRKRYRNRPIFFTS